MSNALFLVRYYSAETGVGARRSAALMEVKTSVENLHILSKLPFETTQVDLPLTESDF